MGRRSDHSRAELESLIVTEGHGLMAEVGFARFSAREVAKRIGYSVGTVYNVMGTHDRLMLSINTRTFRLWANHLRACLADQPGDRIAALVGGYFSFARENTNLWMAIYDHRLPPGEPMPEDYAAERGELTGIVAAEIARVLPSAHIGEAPGLARSLVATVHGHCFFELNGTFALLGEKEPQSTALLRVRESLNAAV